MVDLAYSIADQNVATTKSIGIYNFSVQLLRHLATHPEIQNLTVFSNRTISEKVPLPERVRVDEYNSAIDTRFGRILWDQWGVLRAAKASGRPWLFLPKGFCSFIAQPRVRLAVFVHDIMIDYYYRRYPGFWSRLECLYFSRCLAATVRHAAVIFTNTEFSKHELLALARRNGQRKPNVVVTGYGFEPATAPPAEKENRMLLFASNMPHKRTDIAIRFLDRWLRQSNFDGTIDCIGIFPAEMEKPSGPRWNWIGRVPPGQGREMIRRARAVIYVSEYEGFGMPPVEAALEGTCPVFSGIPPLREVMGEAGCAFSNESPDSFLEAMTKAAATTPETIRRWSETLIQRHNWGAVTNKIVSAISEA